MGQFHTVDSVEPLCGVKGRSLQKYGHRNKVRLCRVHGHIKILGNKQAEELARWKTFILLMV